MLRPRVLSVLLLAVIGPPLLLRAGSELGVMWQPSGEAAADQRLATELDLHRSRWIRQMDNWPAAPVSHPRSVVFWPPGLDAPDPAADLRQIYRQARQVRDSVRTAAAVELGNEPDIHFSHALPDQFAAACKAAWHGLRAAAPEVRVLMPSLAAEPGPYARLLARNGIARFTSAWNLHFYGWAQDYPGALAAHRRFCEELDLPRLPLWVTELGFANFPAAATVDDLSVHLARQQTFFEAAAAAGASHGAAQQWAFAAGPYQFGGRDHGLHNGDRSARPAWASWLRLTELLARARPIHRLRSTSDHSECGWVFAVEEAGQTRWWTVLASPQRSADLGLPPDLTAPTVPSRSSTVRTVALSFPPSTQPVRLGLDAGRAWPGSVLQATVSSTQNLHVWTAAHRFGVTGCRWESVSEPAPPHSHIEPAPGEVVLTLRPIGPQVSADKSAVAYRISSGLPLGLELTAYNFSSQPAEGAWRLMLPGNWPEAPTPLRGETRIEAGSMRRWTNWIAVPPGLSCETRAELAAHWKGQGRAERDTAVIRVAAGGQPAFPAVLWGREWEPVELVSVWQRAVEGPGAGQWWCAGQPANPALALAVPDGVRLRPDDLLRLRLRCTRPLAAPVEARLDLLTPGRRVFQSAASVPLSMAWQTLELRVGDTTPGFWSHTTAETETDARWVRLALLGLSRNEPIEFGELEFLRRP